MSDIDYRYLALELGISDKERDTRRWTINPDVLVSFINRRNKHAEGVVKLLLKDSPPPVCTDRYYLDKLNYKI